MARNFQQIASGVDVIPLLLEIQSQPQLWNANPIRLLPTGPHYETEDIWLRYKDETENKASGDWSNFGDEHDPIWYQAYYRLPSARKIIFDLMARVCGERLGGIFIYRVPPGKQIYEHTDTGWHVDYYDKFNVCLKTNPGAAFHYQGESMRVNMGDVHWFRNNIPHSVTNDGDDDHIIMTVCLRLDRKETLCRPVG